MKRKRYKRLTVSFSEKYFFPPNYITLDYIDNKNKFRSETKRIVDGAPITTKYAVKKLLRNEVEFFWTPFIEQELMKSLGFFKRMFERVVVASVATMTKYCMKWLKRYQ